VGLNSTVAPKRKGNGWLQQRMRHDGMVQMRKNSEEGGEPSTYLDCQGGDADKIITYLWGMIVDVTLITTASPSP
jgi:hypothetical protein